jgi:hypothetical protein
LQTVARVSSLALLQVQAPPLDLITTENDC